MTDDSRDVLKPPVKVHDWTGDEAPPCGTHTGSCTITMLDGAMFPVAHSPTEALRKILDGSAPTNPGGWVAFDRVGSGLPIVLAAGRISSVT